MTAVYTITSGLHDDAAVSRISDEFLQGVFPQGGYEFKGADFRDFGTHDLDLIYVRTGGAEGIFKSLLPEMLARGVDRYYLLTSGKSNSLAASLEILSFLRQQQIGGEVIHGSEEYFPANFTGGKETERLGCMAQAKIPGYQGVVRQN